MADEQTTESTVATSNDTNDSQTETNESLATEAKTEGAESTESASESTDSEQPAGEAKAEVETKSTEQTAEQTTESTAEPEKVERVVPEADKYNLPEGVPQNVAEFAHKNDMTQEQLDETLKEFGGYIQNTKIAEQKLLREQGEAHVKSWGEKADYNLSLVRRALAQNDPDGHLTKVLDDTGFGNHPVVLDFFLKLGDQLKEGGFLKGSVNRPPGKKTAAQTMFGNSHPSKDV